MTAAEPGPDHGAPASHEPTSRPAALALTGLSLAFGVIGVAVGFATLLGIAATASAGDDAAAGYGAMTLTAASSLVLGALLVAGAALLWRAHRWSRVVIGVAVSLLTASSLVRMVVDTVTFMSVLGTVLSLCALTVMVLLLTGDGVREHVREGTSLRLR